MAANTGDSYGTRTPGLIRCYGCVKCQREHREGIDAEFVPHDTFQSKHGIYQRLPSETEKKILDAAEIGITCTHPALADSLFY
jgi:hypothetical protein